MPILSTLDWCLVVVFGFLVSYYFFWKFVKAGVKLAVVGALAYAVLHALGKM